MFDSVMDFEDYLITNPGIEIAYVCIMKSIMGRVLLSHETTISSEQLEMIKQFYGYTDENIETLWAEKIWSDHISPLGMEADGPLVQLNSIPTFLGVGCHLISLSETGTRGVKNQLNNPLINIATILYTIAYSGTTSMSSRTPKRMIQLTNTSHTRLFTVQMLSPSSQELMKTPLLGLLSLWIRRHMKNPETTLEIVVSVNA